MKLYCHSYTDRVHSCFFLCCLSHCSFFFSSSSSSSFVFAMESKNPARFTLGKQSSLAPERHNKEAELQKDGEAVDQGVRLMYSAFEGDVDGICEALESGVSVTIEEFGLKGAQREDERIR